MSILTSASSSSVYRGYEYNKQKRVEKVQQLNDYEYEGYVQGSLKTPYYVKINIKHPRKSYCDCPHANGNIVCKHMTALYFSLFPEEVEDYECWLNNDYEEDDEDNYYDYYEDEYEDEEYDKFEKPIFFDNVLEEYVDDLSKDEMRDILLTEFHHDEERTYNLYLKKNYQKYLGKNQSEFSFLNKINTKLNERTEYYNYNYQDYSCEILSSYEKRKIAELYKNPALQLQLDQILVNEKLAVYSDYQWFVKRYKTSKTKEEINEFSNLLEQYLNSLKHYSIKNNTPKANVLIAMYLLNDFTIDESAQSILKNAKYSEYVDYVVENSDDVLLLYEIFMKLIQKKHFINKEYIPTVLHSFIRFINISDDADIYINYFLYCFLCWGDSNYLDLLSHCIQKDQILHMVESKTKNIFLLAKLYRYCGKVDKLWNLLINSHYQYLLSENIDVLRDKYNEQLYNHFINEFYTILKEGKKREVYYKASVNIVAISKLNNGSEYVQKIIADLKKSSYQKCSALFDEINDALTRSNNMV